MNAPLTATVAATDRRRLANALRFLAIDAVEAAKTGHPGMSGYGEAAPAGALYEHFGLTANAIATAAAALCATDVPLAA